MSDIIRGNRQSYTAPSPTPAPARPHTYEDGVEELRQRLAQAYSAPPAADTAQRYMTDMDMPFAPPQVEGPPPIAGADRDMPPGYVPKGRKLFDDAPPPPPVQMIAPPRKIFHTLPLRPEQDARRKNHDGHTT